MQNQPLEVFCKKGVLRNFAKFTEKQLYQRPFFNKVAGLRRQNFMHIIEQKFIINET